MTEYLQQSSHNVDNSNISNKINSNIHTLLTEFFMLDDLKQITLDAGILLGCPLLVLDGTFHIIAHYSPPGFSDALFDSAVRCGEITYEVGAIISRSPVLCSKTADYIKLIESPYPRRFAPLISAGVRLGYLVCVDTDGHLEQIPVQTWHLVEQILSKQLFVEASRQNRTFETTEDILINLLDGGFSSEAHFRLQTVNTWLSDFNPYTFALIDLTAYHSTYNGKRHLKEEVESQFPLSHPFLYKGSVFLFLQKKEDISIFSAMAAEFQLKVIVSEPLKNLFDITVLYHTAHEALELITDERFHGKHVCFVEQLRTPLLLKNLEGRDDLIPNKLRILEAHDREKDTQYCETLYYYLICCHSLKKTCDVLFTHRNTILYRIRKMQEDFFIPLDEPSWHADLLFGVSLILFRTRGPDFFCIPQQNKIHADIYSLPILEKEKS